MMGHKICFVFFSMEKYSYLSLNYPCSPFLAGALEMIVLERSNIHYLVRVCGYTCRGISAVIFTYASLVSRPMLQIRRVNRDNLGIISHISQ